MSVNEFAQDPAIAEKPPVGLQEYIHLVLANRWIVLSFTGAFLVCSTIFFFMLPNEYTATAQILVSKVDNAKQGSDLLMPSFKGEEDYYGTQIAIIRSRKLRAIVHKELRDTGKYSINIWRQRGTSILMLTVTHQDPILAARIANKYAETYVREGVRENQVFAQQIVNLVPTELGQGAEGVPSSLPAGVNRERLLESLSNVANDPEIKKTKDEQLEVEGKLNTLSQRYKPQHPEMRELQERLAYLDAQIRERTERILSNLKENLVGEVRFTNIKVMESAEPPTKPSAPNRLRGILTGTFLGFAAGVLFVLLFEFSNQRIRTEKDLLPEIQIPFLGYIPMTEYFIQDKKERLKRKISVQAPPVSIAEALRLNPQLADAVASVRTHILFSMPYEKSRRIMFTSALPNEGKTTVSTLLALSLTSLGRRILLIDADLRRPFLHETLGIPNERGLCDYLSGQAKISEIVRSVPSSNLKVITGGSPIQNPSEMLASELMRELLDTLENEYDRIVIDVPPVLYIPDGLIMAKFVHSGVLICGSGMVHKEIVKLVKQKFDSIGHSFIGIVINRADYQKDPYRYKYYSSYRSYYQTKGEADPKAK